MIKCSSVSIYSSSDSCCSHSFKFWSLSTPATSSHHRILRIYRPIENVLLYIMLSIQRFFYVPNRIYIKRISTGTHWISLNSTRRLWKPIKTDITYKNEYKKDSYETSSLSFKIVLDKMFFSCSFRTLGARLSEFRTKIKRSLCSKMK